MELSSYSSRNTGLTTLARETCELRQAHSGVGERVAANLETLKQLEDQVLHEFGLELKNLSILDIGCGQLLIQLLFFARSNRAIGIDWDIVPNGVDPGAYLRMLWRNGVKRTVKTAGRKLLGIDRRYRREVMRQLELKTLPKLEVRQMDACNLTFPDGTFDFVHSYSVFHHLVDPASALDHVVRVLKPRGVAYIALHLFSSQTGCLDMREIHDEKGDIVYWPHLRPAFASQVSPHAQLNKLRIREWQMLFQAKMPGARVVIHPCADDRVTEEAQSLLNRGEIVDYSLEELTSHRISVTWRKPDNATGYLQSAR